VTHVYTYTSSLSLRRVTAGYHDIARHCCNVGYSPHNGNETVEQNTKKKNIQKQPGTLS